MAWGEPSRNSFAEQRAGTPVLEGRLGGRGKPRPPRAARPPCFLSQEGPYYSSPAAHWRAGTAQRHRGRSTSGQSSTRSQRRLRASRAAARSRRHCSSSCCTRPSVSEVRAGGGAALRAGLPRQAERLCRRTPTLARTQERETTGDQTYRRREGRVPVAPSQIGAS